MRRLLLALALLPTVVWAQPVTTPEPVALACAFSNAPPSLVSGTFGFVQCNSQGQLLLNPSALTITAGQTPTSGITSGDLLYSSGNLIADSQVPVSLGTFTSPVIFTGTTSIGIGTGQLAITGTLSPMVTGANGEGWIGVSPSNGLQLEGQGSINDVSIINKNGVVTCREPTGTQQWTCTGAINGANFVPTGTGIPANGLYLPLANTPGMAANTTTIQNWNTAGTSIFVPAFIANTPNAAGTDPLCISTATSAVSWATACTASDERLKNIGRPIDSALDKLLRITGFYFTYKDPGQYGQGRQIGVGAQTVEKAFPEIVHTDGNGIENVDYGKLTAPIIEAIRDLKHDNDKLHACQSSWRCRLFGWK